MNTRENKNNQHAKKNLLFYLFGLLHLFEIIQLQNLVLQIFFWKEKILDCADFTLSRSSRPDVLCKKGILKNFSKFTGKHLCQSRFLMRLQTSGLRFIKKETLAQVFSCEFCKISKNTFFYRTYLGDCFWN